MGADTEIGISAVGKGVASGVVVEVVAIAILVTAIGARRLVLAASAGAEIIRVAARALACAICWIITVLDFASGDVPEVFTDAVVVPRLRAFRTVRASSLIVWVGACAGRIRRVLACWRKPARRRVGVVMA